ncbi:MAG: hypothetical protein EXS02_08400 [Planctomycetes bacterium]|nr:hypothetical protein [Planctomycetota bacterium]
MFRAVLLLLALLAALPAQASETVICRVCANTGMLPCKAHGKAMLEKEHSVHFCSAAMECKICGGTLQVDCKSCRNEKSEAELAKLQKRMQDWRADRKLKVDDVAKGLPLMHLQTAHFELAYGIKPQSVGREKFETHPAMHLYGERLETLRTEFMKLLGAEDGELNGRLQVFMSRDQLGQQNLAPIVTQGLGGGKAVGVKSMGLLSVYCMWQEPTTLPDDEALHRNIIHNTTHLLLCNLAPSLHLYDKHVGWIDEGFSHWFEDKLTGKCTNFCYEEVLMQAAASFKGGRWRAPVRRMVDEGKLTSFAALAQKNTDELDFPQHAQSFALIDWLLTVHGGPKFKTFIGMIKAGKATRDALQAVYNTTPIAIDTEFSTWVKANYSPQEPR